MGWGTCYIEPEGYLNRITIEQIEDEIETEERRVKDAFDKMAIIMASSPTDIKYEDGEELQAWPEDVVRQVRSISVDENQEHVFVLYLDTQRHLLCEPAVISRGTANSVLIHPREIFRNAIKLGAISIVVAHNHPGGDATLSGEDVEQTKRLIETGQCVGIPLDDHIIIARDAWTSMREQGGLDFADDDQASNGGGER